VLLIGADALPSSVPNHASALYARNIAALIEHVVATANAEPQPKGGPQSFCLDLDDPIVAGCLLTHGGECRRPDVVSGVKS
jgi:NAD(P) transhydrogenase subunit alpha